MSGEQRRFSRDAPTPHYGRLIGFYQDLHRNGAIQRGDAEGPRVAAPDTFDGAGLLAFAPRVRTIAQRHGARSILDYGSGKGFQYQTGRALLNGEPTSLMDYWGVSEINVFDPGVSQHKRPVASDGVICTDVLEHCFHADIPWIVEEIFSLARAFVWCNIDCFAAQKLLPNGENVHITVRHPEYWRGVFEATANRFPGVDWEIGCRFHENGDLRRPPVMTYYQRAAVETEIGADTRFTRR